MAIRQLGEERSDCFEEWFRCHQRDLVAYCTRFLGDPAAAADVAQEALLRAWLRRGDFEGTAHVRRWLWRVARNLCIDTIRSRQRLVPSEVVPEAAGEAGEAGDPVRPVELEEERRSVRAAMARLSERHRSLLYRREVEGVGYDQLSSDLGLTPEGARAVVFRARRSLQQQLRVVAEGAAAGFAGLRVAFDSAARWVTRPVGTDAAAALVPSAVTAVTLALAAGLALVGPIPRPPVLDQVHSAPVSVAAHDEGVAAVTATAAALPQTHLVPGPLPPLPSGPEAVPEAVLRQPGPALAISLGGDGVAVSAAVPNPLTTDDTVGVRVYRDDGDGLVPRGPGLLTGACAEARALGVAVAPVCVAP